MEYDHLLTLCDTLAGHWDRSPVTVAKRAGVHARLFGRLRAGHGCRVDTYRTALAWLGENWPRDLEWPRDIPRPSKSKKEAA